MSKVNARKRGTSWQYYFEGAKVGGKRQRVVKSGFETEKAALKAGNAALYEYSNGGQAYAVSDISVADFFASWLEMSVKPNCAPETHKRYSNMVAKRVNPYIGSFHIRNVTTETLQRLLNNMQDEGLRKATMSFFRTLLMSAFGYAVKTAKHLKVNPALDTSVPKSKTAPLEKLTIDVPTFARLLKQYNRDENHHLAPLIAFHTGLRKGEVLGLTWDDIDLEGRQITVRKQLKQNQRGYCYGELKTKQSARTIGIGSVLVEELRAHKSRIRSDRMRIGEYYAVYYMANSGALVKGYSGDDLSPVIAYPVCVKPNGEMVTPNMVDHHIQGARAAIGLPEMTFHALRHTHATLLIESGANVKSVSQRLGHANITVTLQTYTHVTDRMESETVGILDTLTAALGRAD